MKLLGFFAVDERLAPVTGPDDQIGAFSRVVDFGVFPPDLDKALPSSAEAKALVSRLSRC